MPQYAMLSPASPAHAMALAAERRREAKALQRRAAALPEGKRVGTRLLQRAERALEVADRYLEMAKGDPSSAGSAPPSGLAGPALIARL
jgi:hypothetical protein